MSVEGDKGTERGQGLPLERADHLLDALVERVRGAALRTAALAREEAEDAWAEAKALRARSGRASGGD